MFIKRSLLLRFLHKHQILLNVIFVFFMFMNFSLRASDTTLIQIIDVKNPIRTMVKDMDGNILVQVMNNVFKLNNGKLIKAQIEIQPNDKLFIYEGKLTTVDKLEKSKLKIPRNFNLNLEWNKFLAKSGTEDYCVVYKDNFNNYWVNNGDNFLYRFTINNYFERGLNRVSTRGIYQSNKNLYVNTYKGFFKNGVNKLDGYLDGSSNIIENSGKLYFASVGKIYAFNLTTEELDTIYNDYNSNSTYEISSISFFDNKFWFGALRGLFSLTSDGKPQSEGINERVHNLRIRGNSLFILTDLGIYIYEKGKFRKLQGLPSYVRYNDIEVVNGYFYIASSVGLLFYNSKKNIFENVFRNSNFKSNECFSIEKDNYNNLWIGTVSGLIRYNYITYMYEVFYKNVEFNKRSTFTVEDEFYFGSTEGYFRFLTNRFSAAKTDDVAADISYNSPSNKYVYQIIIFIILSLSFFIYHKWKLKRVIIENEKREKLLIEDSVSIEEEKVVKKYKMSNIEKYILDHIDDITVEKLREDSGYTKNVFYKIFSRYYDVTPKQLIDSIKEESVRKKRGYERKR